MASKSKGKKGFGSRLKNFFTRKKDTETTRKRRVVVIGGAG